MPSPGVSSDPRPLVAPLKQRPIRFSPFDQHHYQRLIRAREEAIRHVLHGDIMGWLNASDLLHTNGLFVVGSVFASLRAVEWLTGRPARFNPNGMTVDIRTLPS